MPESLTTWKVKSWALGPGTRVGQAEPDGLGHRASVVVPGVLGPDRGRVPGPALDPAATVDPAGQESYNAFSARLEHRFSGGLYFLNSFTWSKALGNSEQALEYAGGYYAANPQNIYNLAAERGPSSFDEKFINVTSIVYQENWFMQVFPAKGTGTSGIRIARVLPMS